MGSGCTVGLLGILRRLWGTEMGTGHTWLSALAAPEGTGRQQPSGSPLLLGGHWAILVLHTHLLQ